MKKNSFVAASEIDEMKLGGEGENVRKVVVETLSFVADRIKQNLSVDDPGVAAVLEMIEDLRFTTGKPLAESTKKEIKGVSLFAH